MVFQGSRESIQEIVTGFFHELTPTFFGNPLQTILGNQTQLFLDSVKAIDVRSAKNSIQIIIILDHFRKSIRMIKQLSPCFLKKKSFKFSANLEEKSGIIPVVLQHLVSQIDFFEKHICLMSYFIQLPTLAIMGAAIQMSDSNCFRRRAVFGATIYDQPFSVYENKSLRIPTTFSVYLSSYPQEKAICSFGFIFFSFPGYF